MINHREVIRRYIKYFIVLLTVSYAAISIPVKKLLNRLKDFIHWFRSRNNFCRY